VRGNSGAEHECTEQDRGVSEVTHRNILLVFVSTTVEKHFNRSRYADVQERFNAAAGQTPAIESGR
jgi:hypothetical protein